MQSSEDAISEATERLAKLSKLWPSKGSRTQFLPKKILCFVDANAHSEPALDLTIKLSQEFDADFSIRSLFDNELQKIADTELLHLKESIINIVKRGLQDTGLSKGITFLEGDAIESIQNHLAQEYDIIVLPVPYHSNLSDHPDAVAMGSLGEYLVDNIEKPLIIVPDIEEVQKDIFSSITIVVSDIADILQSQNYLQAMMRNRSHVRFVFLYNAKDIETLAEASKGVVNAEVVKDKVRTELTQYGKHVTERYAEYIEEVSYSIYDGSFSENIAHVIDETSSSMLIMILPENKKGYQYLLFQDLLRDKSLVIPALIFHTQKEQPADEQEGEEDTEEENPAESEENGTAGEDPVS